MFDANDSLIPPIHSKTEMLHNRSFSLTWPAAMQIYWNKRKFLHKKRSSLTPTGLVWYTKMAAVSLFWYTNMAAVTSCENDLYSQEYFQPNISRKIRIFSLGQKNNILIEKKECRSVEKKVISLKQFELENRMQI